MPGHVLNNNTQSRKGTVMLFFCIKQKEKELEIQKPSSPTANRKGVQQRK